MAFSVNFGQLLTTDASIVSYFGPEIFAENVEMNAKLSKDTIVWNFNKISPTPCMTGKANSNYNVTIRLVMHDTVLLEQWNDYLEDKLSFFHNNQFLNITFLGDNHTSNLEEGIYINAMNFLVEYK